MSRTDRPLDTLFSPFRVKSLELPNRVVMSPMERLFATDGVLDPGYAPYYARRAPAAPS